MIWKKRTKQEINDIVFDALNENGNYLEEDIIGLPASYLDSQVFSQDDAILKNAPFLTTLVRNPNHIGCHTLGDSEHFFSGTQKIEKEVIRICSESILKADENSCDGYVASGGTEANIQAIWIYRNFFQLKNQAKNNQIGIICGEDSHYSMMKASNLLNIPIFLVKRTNDEIVLQKEAIDNAIKEAKEEGVQHFICVLNMMTTMFGSVDSIATFVDLFDKHSVHYKIHIDGAYGGFYYPFSNKESEFSFQNPAISSFTLDAHKMAQAPYGTGIFLIRKGLMHYATTAEASYVEGSDCTLIGSRSGANAISIWMILSTYGPHGWMEKIFILQKRTDWLCEQLGKNNIPFYRNPNSNIVTLKKEIITQEIAHKFGLIPDNHNEPNWFKIVIMDHVTIEKLERFLAEIL